MKTLGIESDGNGSGAVPENATPTGLAALTRAASQPVMVPHLIVSARAGTGKSTTLLEGLRRLKGVSDGKLIPSPQQAAVWESMALSKNAKSFCMVAFNKSIAAELASRVPPGVEAMTMHSMGFRAVRSAFGNVKVDDWRVKNIISEITGRDIRELFRTKPEFVNATQSLVGLCKMNLVHRDKYNNELDVDDPIWIDVLDNLARHYDVEMNGSREEVFAIVPKILERCKDVTRDNCVDFNDMVWLPIALDIPMAKYDVLLIDESQDLNRTQQAIAKRCGKRLIFVGDDRQSIYGFCGADTQSLSRLATELAATLAGCITLPLTVTRRCGKAIVEEAKRIVPDFEAHESNGPGLISHLKYDDDENSARDGAAQSCYRGYAKNGDMVLCRVNAPLVSQCFKFLKAGRRANIQGRDIGKGLISIIKKMDAKDLPELLMKLSEWKHSECQKENAKKNPSESRLIMIQDRYDCLCCFCEDRKTVEDVLNKIESVFTDDKQGSGIRLSSIHKAKGLEADNVFFLMPKGGECPHPMAKSHWQREQEMNLKYVGLTRARNILVYVT